MMQGRKQLRQIQLCQLDLILEVDRICKRNGIVYFLVDGTCLGAKKYKGFIPWDDDADVGMDYSNYLRFLKACEKELDGAYFLQTFETDNKYGNCFAQLRIKNTVFKQRGWNNQITNCGVFIDIHPFVSLPENPLLLKFYVLKAKLLKIALLKKSGFAIKKRDFYYILVLAFSSLHSRKNLIKKINRFCLKCEGKYVKSPKAFKVFGRHLDKDYIFKNNSQQLRLTEFEGYHFPVQPDCDRMLSAVYGDYMNTEPNLAERENRHDICEIDISNYEIRNKAGK